MVAGAVEQSSIALATQPTPERFEQMNQRFHELMGSPGDGTSSMSRLERRWSAVFGDEVVVESSFGSYGFGFVMDAGVGVWASSRRGRGPASRSCRSRTF